MRGFYEEIEGLWRDAPEIKPAAVAQMKKYGDLVRDVPMDMAFRQIGHSFSEACGANSLMLATQGSMMFGAAYKAATEFLQPLKIVD